MSATISGISHIALTVRDLEASVAWYCEVLGLTRLFEWTEPDHEFVVLLHPVTEVMLGLHRHSANDGSPGSEYVTGLDHVGFSVEGREALEAWARVFQERGVVHSPIVEAPYGHVLSFRDPDNIPLELFALRER